MTDLAVFDQHFRQWAYAACAEWEYPPPTVEWLESVHARLPVGLRTELGRGIEAHAFRTVGGHRFAVPNGGEGPHDWFSEQPQRQQPAPNWERFVQLAEYTRIRLLVAGTDLDMGFEDQHMDVTVRRGTDLLWFVDISETFATAYETSRHLDRLGAAGIAGSGGSADDALRTAQLIVKQRPLYYSMVGIGGRLDFSVAVHDAHHFDLIPDLVPVGSHA